MRRGGVGGARTKKIAAMLLFPILPYARPGPGTQYLMHEPAKLLLVISDLY